MADDRKNAGLSQFGGESLLIAAVIAIKTFTASTAQAQCPSTVPDLASWHFEIQCRSSLGDGITTLNLPFPSSFSSQYVLLDEAGGVAVSYVSSGAQTEGVFYGVFGSGAINLVAGSQDFDCSPIDYAEPFGVHDYSDVIAFLTLFSSNEPGAEFAEPIGIFDFTDVVAFLTEFGAGCP